MAKIVFLKKDKKYVWFYDIDYKIGSDSKPVYKYFIDGEGWKKTKSFTILEDSELPDKWTTLPNLRIMEITDKYGSLIGKEYMERKTCGYYAQRDTNVLYSIYEKVKHLLKSDNEIDVNFFELLEYDHIMATLGIYFFSPFKTDEKFSKNDPEYDGENCIYKGKKEVSMQEYVKEKFGQKYVDIIDKLCLPKETVKELQEIIK